MPAQVLHQPPEHHGHPVLHQAPVLQLREGCSKHLGVLGWPGSEDRYLDHLLHILRDQHCCLIVLDGEKQILSISMCSFHQVKVPKSVPQKGGLLGCLD